MHKWYPADVIALTALVICGILQMLGHNHVVTTSFAGIIAAYIGVDIAFKRRR